MKMRCRQKACAPRAKYTQHMKPLKILSMSFLTGLSGALMPGPVLAITISSVVKVGFIAAVLIILGHSILELVLVAALALGLRNVLKNRFVTGTIGVAGGSVLLWFAYGMVASAYAGISPPSDQEAVVTSFGLISKGAIASLSNPYWLIWWATIGATYMLVSLEKNIVGISTFYIGHISADFAWYCVVAGVLILGKEIFSGSIYKIYTGIIMVCGIFLLFLGIYFFYSGIKTFIRQPAIKYNTPNGVKK